MTETTTTPTPTEDDYTAGYADGIPPELAPHYRHGPITEAEVVAMHGDEAKDWLRARELRTLRDEMDAWGAFDRQYVTFGASRAEKQRELMPTVLAVVKDGELIGDTARRLADRPLTPDERVEFVHVRRLGEARRAHQEAEAAEQRRRQHEQATRCEVCGAHQPTNTLGYSTLRTVEAAAGRSARVCTGCALLVPAIRAERAAAELVDGATRRQHVEAWLDGR